MVQGTFRQRGGGVQIREVAIVKGWMVGDKEAGVKTDLVVRNRTYIVRNRTLGICQQSYLPAPPPLRGQ